MLHCLCGLHCYGPNSLYHSCCSTCDKSNFMLTSASPSSSCIFYTHRVWLSVPICITVPSMSVAAVWTLMWYSLDCVYVRYITLLTWCRQLAVYKTYIACIQFYQLWMLHICKEYGVLFSPLLSSRLTGRNKKRELNYTLIYARCCICRFHY
jgi:hypothetical protein